MQPLKVAALGKEAWRETEEGVLVYKAGALVLSDRTEWFATSASAARGRAMWKL
jgi:hypothetical protein